MSPERTSHATSLPVRTDRAPRADHAAAGDMFATLLGAHADRAERAPEPRERRRADDASPGQRDRHPVERPADHGRPAAAHAPAQPAGCDEPAAPADDAATAAALLALGVPTAPATPAPAAPTPGLAATQPATAETQLTPPDALALAAGEQVADTQAAQPPQGVPTGQQAAPTQPVPAAGVPTAGEPATPAVPLEPEADAEPVPAGDTATDHTAELPNLPSAPAPRAEAKTHAPTDPAAGLPTTPTPAGEASARQGDGRPPQHEQDRPATQAAQPAAPASTTRTDFAPATAPAPGTPAVNGRGAVTLSQAPRAVGQVIHLASQKGVQAARLNLRPVELGGIEIRLLSTAAGVAAQVVADSPQAARLLQQASDELRRSLASQNVELLSLDVSTSGDDRRDAGAAGDLFGAFGDSATRGHAGFGRSQRSVAAAADTDLPTPTQGTVLELPDGVLVDVLA
jgi:flagellar hook-length control protein FliK